MAHKRKLRDYETGVQIRDIIKKLAVQVVDRERPRHQYAIVDSIDRPNRSCMVVYPGDTTPVKVSMGSIQPVAIGQTVRISGVRGDRFIDDVMGLASGAPIGSITMWPILTPPTDWLICNGQVTTGYSELIAVVGANVPDLRDRFPIGASGTKAEGTTGGSATRTLTQANMPSHDHTVASRKNANAWGAQDNASEAGGAAGTGSSFNTGLKGGDAAFSILNPYLSLNFIIYAGPPG